MATRLLSLTAVAAFFVMGCATTPSGDPQVAADPQPADRMEAGADELDPGRVGVAGSVVDEEILEDGLDPSRPAEEQPEVLAQMQPQYEWLEDDEGKRYRIEQLEKTEGLYRRVGDNRIRTVWGPTIDVVREDDDYFYFKVYDTTGMARQAVPTGPTDAEKAADAASYRVDLVASDRVSFEPYGQGLPSRGQWRNGFRLVDMNDDGLLDLVHGSSRKPPGAPVVFLNGGDGTWRPWRDLRLPRFGYDYGDIAVGDWNGDGHNDLALAMHLRGVTALIGDGRGGFELWNEGLEYAVAGQRGGALPGFTSRALEAMDWNGDGRLDLVALGEGPHLVRGGQNKGVAGRAARGITVYLNQGDGSWETLVLSDARDQVFGDDLTTADLDGDGRLEVVSSSHLQGQTGIIFDAEGEEGWLQRHVDGIRPRAYIHSTTGADFDGNGRVDLAVGYMSWALDSSWRAAIDLFLQTGPWQWERSTLRSAKDTLKRIRSMDTGDVDGDGHLDLVAATEEGTVELFLGDGRGGFTRETAPELVGPEGDCAGYHVVVEDLDGDGMSEIVAAFAGEQTGIITLTNCPSGGGIRAWTPKR